MNKKQRLKQIKEVKELHRQWIKSFIPMIEIEETPLLNKLRINRLNRAERDR